MKNYIVTIILRGLDAQGIEAGDINTLHIPTLAESELEALKAAVVYNSDGGKAVENERLEIECKELSRGLVWIATKALKVTPDDMFTFLSLTQGVSTHTMCISSMEGEDNTLNCRIRLEEPTGSPRNGSHCVVLLKCGLLIQAVCRSDGFVPLGSEHVKKTDKGYYDCDDIDGWTWSSSLEANQLDYVGKVISPDMWTIGK